MADFQKEHGGIPEICPIFQLRTTHFEKNESLGDDCRNGKILCGQCKGQAAEEVTGYLKGHQEKLADARGKIKDFLLTVPIESILK